MSHDWSSWWSEYPEAHKVVLTDEQELYTRALIYELIGKKGTFVMHFEDLKFSAPLHMVHGFGSLTYDGHTIRYEIKKDHTILHCDDRKALVNIVLEALDEHLD
jgi:hypothetical protein